MLRSLWDYIHFQNIGTSISCCLRLCVTLSSRCPVAVAFFSLLLSQSNTGFSQGNPRFPFEPHQWLNTTPYTLEGKGVVLWYFEEGCPRCRAKWPELIKLSEKYADQPVLFVAVNSGTPRTQLVDYVKAVNLKWPVLVDLERSFEKQSEVGEISLHNIFQIASIDGGGQFQQGRWDDLEGAVKRALTNARWKLPPTDLPTELLAAWRVIEFGQFADAAQTLTRSKVSNDLQVKSASERLLKRVDQSISQDISSLSASTDKWQRYVQMRVIADRYRGYPLPAEFRAEGSLLHQDPEIKQRLSAQ